MVICVREEQQENASFAIYFTFFGMVSRISVGHLMKDLSPIQLTLSGIVQDGSFLPIGYRMRVVLSQSNNTPSSEPQYLFPLSTLNHVREQDVKNAYSSIYVTLGGDGHFHQLRTTPECFFSNTFHTVGDGIYRFFFSCRIQYQSGFIFIEPYAIF